MELEMILNKNGFYFFMIFSLKYRYKLELFNPAFHYFHGVDWSIIFISFN